VRDGSDAVLTPDWLRRAGGKLDPMVIGPHLGIRLTLARQNLTWPAVGYVDGPGRPLFRDGLTCTGGVTGGASEGSATTTGSGGGGTDSVIGRNPTA
jgi:hypothetical protein